MPERITDFKKTSGLCEQRAFLSGFTMQTKKLTLVRQDLGSEIGEGGYIRSLTESTANLENQNRERGGTEYGQAGCARPGREGS